MVEKEREVPSIAGARELSNAREVTKQLKAIDDTKRGAHVSRKVEDIVGRRVGDRCPMWLTELMRGGYCLRAVCKIKQHTVCTMCVMCVDMGASGSC